MISAVPLGWQCSICNRVYSPTTIMCPYCGNETYTTSTSFVEKIKNAETSDWLREGFSDEELKEIIDKAKNRDCNNCKHYKPIRSTSGLDAKIYACSRWECEFEPKEGEKNDE